ncbi:MAG: hypothetical protein KDA88_13950 [Planctomycetaceae bacterium]|nr:hypothetical protein [Planctomycetaceae bacterium]
MKTFEIEPLKGVGPVRFGMSRDEVRKLLGTPDSVNDNREWFLDGFAVDYDSTGKVEFVEFAISSKFRVAFKGKCLHEMYADDAVAFVSEFAPYDATDPELGYTYMFPKLQLSLWRPTMPEPDQPEDAPAGRRFHAVGAAADGYFEL